MLSALARQILFQRFNYAIPSYGSIHIDSLFKASQVTHFGLVVQGDDDRDVRFYEEVLGLLHIRDVEDTHDGSDAGRAIFELEPGSDISHLIMMTPAATVMITQKLARVV